MFSQLETSSNLLWSKIGHSFQISGWNHLPDGTWREGQYLFQLAAWQIVSNSRLWLSQLPSQGGEVGCLLSWVGRWQQQYVTMPHHNTHQSQSAVRVWEYSILKSLSPFSNPPPLFGGLPTLYSIDHTESKWHREGHSNPLPYNNVDQIRTTWNTPHHSASEQGFEDKLRCLMMGEMVFDVLYMQICPYLFAIY